MRGATYQYLPDRLVCFYFNPHSPCGERRLKQLYETKQRQFQSTLPMRGATRWIAIRSSNSPFQSTLPMRGATTVRAGQRTAICNFNPHSPCGERHTRWSKTIRVLVFQSTLPMRGATLLHFQIVLLLGYFNPHSPCGERRFGLLVLVQLCLFQSTLPMRGATLLRHHQSPNTSLFQSTLPMRGATCASLSLLTILDNFNPHSPCGERPLLGSLIAPAWRYFNPHSPCGERPERDEYAAKILGISIHTPHAGSDMDTAMQRAAYALFQSTLPMRGATKMGARHGQQTTISIHTPHAGSDNPTRYAGRPRGGISIHTPHAGSDFLSLSTI